MSSLTVLAFDPGGTTGWASYSATKILDPDGNPEYYGERFDGGILGPEPHHLQIEELIELKRTDNFHLVTESFEYRQQDVANPRMKVELISRDYIGVMDLWAQRHDHPIHKQKAALGKGFVDDRKLKALDLYLKRSKHTRDAYRHLIFYMVNRLYMRHIIEPWKGLT